MENNDYLTSQLITYLGNKRSLLTLIAEGVEHSMQELGKSKIDFLDLFSGTGVVSRMARKYSNKIYCNDLEKYSFITNTCYQSNSSNIDHQALKIELERIKNEIAENPVLEGIISELYAPKNDQDIKQGERVFYTRRNAIFLDSFSKANEQTPESLKPFVLAPILAQASVNTNTSGIFKGFHKNKEGIGQFGGSGKNALSRIMKNIEIQIPVFSNYECETKVFQKDANQLVKELPHVDVAYLDPPYNQHPYGSNYFMLNLLCDYRKPEVISIVSGIPKDWNRSAYNKPQEADKALFSVVRDIDADFVLISYNCEGFIKPERFLSGLAEIGKVKVFDQKYNAFRGSRNLDSRDKYVVESLYLVDKRK
jgi:adenine-specific DNA-methyltransferase